MAEPISFTYELLDELGEDHQLGCKCCRFNKGVDLPIPRKVTAHSTREYAKDLTASIFKDWTTLNMILKRFEPTIHKRWLKKNYKQRREILLAAWPNMSQKHRPDFENFRDYGRAAPRSQTCRTDAFVWPYINIEDLQQQQLLLLFLSSRGRNLPDTLRLADVAAAHLGKGWCDHIDFADRSVWCKQGRSYSFRGEDGDQCMLFQDRCSPTAYGKVIDCKEPNVHEDQLKYVSRGQAGLLALEIQRRTYRFLLDCAQLMLRDIKPRKFFLAPHQPEPIMPSGLKPGQWLSLFHHALEAPYRVPQKLDLDALKSLVSARRALAEDHVWSLREDPSYFLEQLTEWNEHSKFKAKSPICACTDCSSRVAGRMLAAAFVSFISWDEIHRVLQSMDPIEIQIQRADKSKLRLKKSDEDRWVDLWGSIEAFRNYPLQWLRDGVPTSPRLRRYFRWAENADSEDGKGEWVMYPGESESVHRVEQLTWSITHRSAVKLHGFHGLVQEIQYMLETDAAASRYMDSWIVGQFSDVTLVSQLFQSIDGLAPWLDNHKAGRAHYAGGEEDNRSRILTLDLTLGIPLVCEEGDLPWPSDKRQFDYPINKPRSKANVEQMRKAEQNLDYFWECMEFSLYDCMAIDLDLVLKERISSTRELHRTPKWREPVETAKKGIVHTPLADVDPNVQSFRTPEPVKSFECTPSKMKTKTRGMPTARDIGAPASAVDAPRPPQEKVKTCKRAFRVFQALLPSPNDVVQQRCELSWDEMIWSFNSVGLVPLKLYGSVWIFRPLPKTEQGPDKVKMNQSLQFHEPKEVRKGAKIARDMVRTFGRRLKHRYGWETAVNVFECV